MSDTYTRPTTEELLSIDWRIAEKAWRGLSSEDLLNFYSSVAATLEVEFGSQVAGLIFSRAGEDMLLGTSPGLRSLDDAKEGSKAVLAEREDW